MIIIHQEVLDKLTEKASRTERLRMNLNLHDSYNAPSQRLLNALEPGTAIPIHKHENTPETYILLRGRLKVIYYDSENNMTESANRST